MRLETADDILELQDHSSVEARINLFILRGVLCATAGSGASHELREAATLAVRYGLSQPAVLAAIGLSIEEQMRGDSNSALSTVEHVLPIARESASKLNFAHLCLRIAEMRTATGHPRRALDLLEDARNAFPIRNYAWTYNNVLSARAFCAAREFVPAKQRASEAVSAARSQRNERVEGAALLALTESLMGLNARSEAVEAVQCAVDCLERSGYPSELARANAMAAKLTGRRRYREGAAFVPIRAAYG